METVKKIFESAGGAWVALGSFALLGWFLSKIEVSKIKINPWATIRKWIGDTFGKEHGEQITALETRLQAIEELLTRHIHNSDRRDAERSRRRILEFEREIQWDIKHSKEEFEDMLETIRQYESYCTEHPDFKNHVAVEAIAHIHEVYRERLRKRDFATGGSTHE